VNDLLDALRVFLKKGWNVYDGPAGIWCCPPKRSHSRIALHRRTFDTLLSREWIELDEKRGEVFVYAFKRPIT